MKDSWEKRFDAEFGGQSQLSQAILGALEYRGFYDAGKYLDDSIAEKIAPILKLFITSVLEEEKKGAIEEMIKLSDEIELSMNTAFDEWRAFKNFRNTMRDKIKSHTNSIEE